jgi:PAS domain-containing protein
MMIDFMLSPVHDEAGRVRFLVPSGFDITNRKKAEDRLRDSEARYRTLFEAIDQGFCVVEVQLETAKGVDYRVVEANPAFFAHAGFPQSIMTQWLREAATPDLEDVWHSDAYGRVARTEEPERFEQGSPSMGRWFDVCYAFGLPPDESRRVAILFSDIT